MTRIPALDRTAEIIAREVADKYSLANINERISCRRGCGYCCHQIVTLSIFEAVRVAKAILVLPNSLLKKMGKQAAINSVINQSIVTDNERWPYQLPCPLLVNNACIIHSNRPIPCQMTNSVSETLCKEQFEQKHIDGHLPIGIVIRGLDMEWVVRSLILRSNDSLSFSELCFQIDLDKLLKYLIDPSKKKMLKRIELLNQANDVVLQAIQKTSFRKDEFGALMDRQGGCK
jgi:Fe-S-cluster containining protein